MSKRYHDRELSNHREWREWTGHYMDQREYPLLRQTMRQARRGHACIWEEDYYLPDPHKRHCYRSWKKYRSHQWLDSRVRTSA